MAESLATNRTRNPYRAASKAYQKVKARAKARAKARSAAVTLAGQDIGGLPIRRVRGKPKRRGHPYGA